MSLFRRGRLLALAGTRRVFYCCYFSCCSDPALWYTWRVSTRMPDYGGVGVGVTVRNVRGWVREWRVRAGICRKKEQSNILLESGLFWFYGFVLRPFIVVEKLSGGVKTSCVVGGKNCRVRRRIFFFPAPRARTPRYNVHFAFVIDIIPLCYLDSLRVPLCRAMTLFRNQPQSLFLFAGKGGRKEKCTEKKERKGGLFVCPCLG